MRLFKKKEKEVLPEIEINYDIIKNVRKNDLLIVRVGNEDNMPTPEMIMRVTDALKDMVPCKYIVCAYWIATEQLPKLSTTKKK